MNNDPLQLGGRLRGGASSCPAQIDAPSLCCGSEEKQPVSAASVYQRTAREKDIHEVGVVPSL